MREILHQTTKSNGHTILHYSFTFENLLAFLSFFLSFFPALTNDDFDDVKTTHRAKINADFDDAKNTLGRRLEGRGLRSEKKRRTSSAKNRWCFFWRVVAWKQPKKQSKETRDEEDNVRNDVVDGRKGRHDAVDDGDG